jgi:hypothetical protein
MTTTDNGGADIVFMVGLTALDQMSRTCIRTSPVGQEKVSLTSGGRSGGGGRVSGTAASRGVWPPVGLVVVAIAVVPPAGEVAPPSTPVPPSATVPPDAKVPPAPTLPPVANGFRAVDEAVAVVCVVPPEDTTAASGGWYDHAWPKVASDMGCELQLHRNMSMPVLSKNQRVTLHVASTTRRRLALDKRLFED